MDLTARETLFEDIFEVTALNPEGKKIFENVNRIAAIGSTYECKLQLDINCQIYSIKKGEKISLALTSTLNLDGSPDDHFSYSSTVDGGETTLADTYDYVMHGRIFKIDYEQDNIVVIAASFGGLLMQLIGEQKHFSNILPDMRLYVLIKKN